MALTDKLTAIANAIRTKTGKSGKLTLDAMPTEIASIQTGSTDVPFLWSGKNAVKIAQYDESWTLADTSFVIGSSASTSATSIKASVSNRFTNTTGSPTYAYGNKDIVVVQTMGAKPIHDSTATGARQLKYGSVYMTWFSMRKTTDTSNKTTRQPYSCNAYMVKYYNSSNAITRAVANYGMYMTAVSPTVASATATSTYVRCSTPTLYYRASSTYESTTNIKLIKDCTFLWHVDIYVVDPFSTVVGSANDMIDQILFN